MGEALIPSRFMGETEITNKTAFPGSELMGMRIRAAVRLPA